MTKEKLIWNLKKFTEEQVNIIANTNKPIGFFKPILIPALNKNIDKLEKYSDLFTNKEGELDIENAFSQLIHNLENIEPFILEVPILDKIELGGGHIKFKVPFTDKNISFDMNDIENLRKSLFEEL